MFVSLVIYIKNCNDDNNNINQFYQEISICMYLYRQVNDDDVIEICESMKKYGITHVNEVE